jgi:hypothetical protein
MLILPIPKYLNELFQYRCLTPVAALCEFGRVMIVTVDAAFVFVVTILRPKHGGTYRAGEMFNVVFSV